MLSWQVSTMGLFWLWQKGDNILKRDSKNNSVYLFMQIRMALYLVKVNTSLTSSITRYGVHLWVVKSNISQIFNKTAFESVYFQHVTCNLGITAALCYTGDCNKYLSPNTSAAFWKGMMDSPVCAHLWKLGSCILNTHFQTIFKILSSSMMHSIKHFKGIFPTWTCVGGRISAWSFDEKTCRSIIQYVMHKTLNIIN